MAKRFAALVQNVRAQKLVVPNAVQGLLAKMVSNASQRTANKEFALRVLLARILHYNPFTQDVKVIPVITPKAANPRHVLKDSAASNLLIVILEVCIQRIFA